MNTRIWKLFTVAAMSGILATSAALADSNQNPSQEIQQDRQAIQDASSKIKNERAQIRNDREKLKSDIRAKRVLRKERHIARMKLRKAKKEVSGASDQPAAVVPASQ